MPDDCEILLIDSNAETLLAALEPAACRDGLHLLGAPSAEEGRELLARYGGVIDAVLISDRLAGGSEAAARIRAVYPRLPVLRFEANGFAANGETGPMAGQATSSETKTVPPPLGPGDAGLPHGLQRALDRARRAINGEPPSASGETRHETGPLVLTERDPTAADAPASASHFAFRLARIAQARSEAEAARAAHLAQRWHHRLTGVLARYAPSVEFRLRYVADAHHIGDEQVPNAKEAPGPLCLALITTVASESEAEARRRARLIAEDLRLLLMHGTKQENQVYHAAPVRSEAALRRLLVPALPRTAVRFSRPSLTAPLPAAALALRGFEPSGEGLPEHVRLLAGHSPGEAWPSLHALCTLLMRQRPATVVDVTLRPRPLTPGENDSLRALAHLMAPDVRADLPSFQRHLTPGEERALAGRAEALLSEPCFEASLYLAQEADALSQPLQAAVAEGFWDAGVQPETARAEVRRGLLDLRAAGTSAPNLARVVTRSEGARLFRWPLPARSAVPGLSATHPTHEFIPGGLPPEGPVLGVRKTGGREQSGTQARLVRLRPDDLRRHVHVLGQTGTGKTTMLFSMLRERMAAGAGVGLIDPHGDLWERALDAVPRARRDDVVLFDPADPRSTARLNLLEYDPERPQEKAVLIEELFGIFKEDMREDWMGPIFQTYMRNACLLAMESEEARGTLLDVVKIFQGDGYRRRLLEAGVSRLVNDFWTEEAGNVGGEIKIENVAPYITSKLGSFIYNDTLRRLIDAPVSTLDFRGVMDEGKILLAKLPKGELGAFGTRLLGTVLVARLLMAALSREDVPEEKRRDFALFVDEFQTFTSRHTASMLSEARKYRLGLILANQTLGQLRPEIRSALGNAGSRIFFRPGPEDYQAARPYLAPPFEREEILRLPNFTAIARLMIDNVPAEPFLLETCPPDEDLPGR